MTSFFIWSIQKNTPSLWRYPENNLFTLRKKKLIPIENLKKALCEKGLFFILSSTDFIQFVYFCSKILIKL